MTSNGAATYVYDAENRLIATAGYSYIYDADGQRVEKCTEGSTPGTCASGATGTLYWRGLGSDTLRETDLAGNLQNNYVFFNGQRVARSDSAGAPHYYFSDHLGSHGVVETVTTSGTVSCDQDIDYYPYGGVENDYCPNVAQNYKFSGKERDAESGLDNFGARYDSSALGRFMTPDWAAKPVTVPYAKFGDPQTLNLYSYVENGPVNKADADGHGDWYSANGRKLGTDGVNDGSVVVVRDPRSVSYTSDHSLIDIAGSGIPLASFSRAEGIAMHDAKNRSDAPNATDRTGGMHEEGFTTTAGKIQNAPAGPTARPGDDHAEIHITTTSETTLKVHVHPAGQGNTQFEQGPSTGKRQDLDNAKSSLNPDMVNAVVGAASGQVSIYNGQGVQATIPLKAFPTQ
jgi:RHS repeat-associated protein